jgi:hypothetical protein
MPGSLSLLLTTTLGWCAVGAAQEPQFWKITKIPAGRTVKLTDCRSNSLTDQGGPYVWQFKDGGKWIDPAHDDMGLTASCFKFSCSDSASGTARVDIFNNGDCSGTAQGFRVPLPNSANNCGPAPTAYLGDWKYECSSSTNDEFVKVELFEGDPSCGSAKLAKSFDLKVDSCFQDFKVTGSETEGYKLSWFSGTATCQGSPVFSQGPMAGGCCQPMGPVSNTCKPTTQSQVAQTTPTPLPPQEPQTHKNEANAGLPKAVIGGIGVATLLALVVLGLVLLRATKKTGGAPGAPAAGVGAMESGVQL